MKTVAQLYQELSDLVSEGYEDSDVILENGGEPQVNVIDEDDETDPVVVIT